MRDGAGLRLRVAVVGSEGEYMLRLRGPLLRALVEAGHEVYALIPLVSKSVRAGIEKIGAQVIEIPLSRTGLKPAEDLRALCGITKILKQLQPDVMLAYTAKAVIYGTIAGRLAGVPQRFSMLTGLGYFFMGAGGDKPPVRQRVVGLIVRRLYRVALGLSERVIFHNPDDIDTVVALGLVRRERTARVYGSGVELGEFPAMPAMIDPVRFLFVGRLLREKGVHEYVETARRVKQRFPDARFTIVGGLDNNPGGVSRAEVDGWVREGVVDWAGQVSNVQAYFAACSVFVLPSWREGTPRSALEAMATARPLIVTDVPGCRETIVDGANGFLVPAKNSAALVEACERFIANPALITTMGEAGRRLAEDRFDARKVAAEMMRIMGIDTAVMTPGAG